MDFLLNNWMLILVALGSGAMLLWPALKGGGAGGNGLSVAETVQKMNRDKAVLIDVRDDAEYEAEHIAQAKHVPLAQLEEKLPKAVKNKSLPLLLLCGHGRRAQAAAAMAKKLGYEQVYCVTGGMAAWKSANMPVTSASKA